jgi:hypothetical protein
MSEIVKHRAVAATWNEVALLDGFDCGGSVGSGGKLQVFMAQEQSQTKPERAKGTWKERATREFVE